MIPTLSICIPTLNRPEFLLQSLNSIFIETSLLDQLEICISNNCSETDYANVEGLLADYASLCNIKYVRHELRLPLDENHHYVKQMATSEYIYFLGDDDFFLRGQLNNLIHLVHCEKPDLAIFNGYLVDADNIYLGMHFALASQNYNYLEAAYRDLRDKGTFGAVLVRREHLEDADFKKLYHTDHAYGCYWLSLFKKHERKEVVKIIIPDFPCVAIRCANKTYNHICVYYKTIPYEMRLRRSLVKQGPLRQLFDEHEVATEKLIASIRFLCRLIEDGHDLGMIRTVNPVFYNRYRLRIWLARQIGNSFIYKILRFLHGKVTKKINEYKNVKAKIEIDYMLSSANFIDRH